MTGTFKLFTAMIKEEILTRVELLQKRFRLGDLLVVSGIITRDQLRDALKRQKETGMKLGDQLIADAVISAYVLKKFLFKQWAHRVACAAAGVLMGGFSVLFPPQTSQADNFNSIIIMAKADITGLDRQEFGREKDNLFSRGYKRYGDLSAFTKWNGMLERMNRQIGMKKNKELMQKWKADLTEFADFDFRDKVAAVNHYVNKTRYVSDMKNFGVTDFWQTPFEFFRSGGDCEDFAITKMLSLRALGVPENRMRITIVQDTKKNIPHAVLIVYDAKGDAYVLDNQEKDVLKDTQVTNYRPIFSLSRESWWRYNS